MLNFHPVATGLAPFASKPFNQIDDTSTGRFRWFFSGDFNVSEASGEGRFEFNRSPNGWI